MSADLSPSVGCARLERTQWSIRSRLRLLVIGVALPLLALGGYEGAIRSVPDVLEKGGEYYNDRRLAAAGRGQTAPRIPSQRTNGK